MGGGGGEGGNVHIALLLVSDAIALSNKEQQGIERGLTCVMSSTGNEERSCWLRSVCVCKRRFR